MLKKYGSLLLFFLSSAILHGAGQSLRVQRDASAIEVEIRASMHSFSAVLENYDANIRVDPEKGTISGADFAFDFGDLETGIKARDRAMLGWVEYGSYPKGRFILTGIRESRGKSVAMGKLTFHGVERGIEIPFSLQRDGSRWTIEAQAVLDYRNWDLEIIKFLFLKVDPILTVRIRLAADDEEGN